MIFIQSLDNIVEISILSIRAQIWGPNQIYGVKFLARGLLQ